MKVKISIKKLALARSSLVSMRREHASHASHAAQDASGKPQEPRQDDGTASGQSGEGSEPQGFTEPPVCFHADAVITREANGQLERIKAGEFNF